MTDGAKSQGWLQSSNLQIAETIWAVIGQITTNVQWPGTAPADFYSTKTLTRGRSITAFGYSAAAVADHTNATSSFGPEQQKIKFSDCLANVTMSDSLAITARIIAR